MALLKENDLPYIRKLFTDLQNEVILQYFGQAVGCQYCTDTLQILEEISDLSDKIELRVYDLEGDAEKAAHLGIDKAPAIAITAAEDYGVRFFGIPSGYEFTSLLEDIVDVSRGDSGLMEESRALLKEVKKELRLQVFVTPTCPHCPKAVRLAHKMAIENPLIRAEMIEATEFPKLAMHYEVRGVPRTIVGKEFPIEGGLPEDIFIKKVVQAAKLEQN